MPLRLSLIALAMAAALSPALAQDHATPTDPAASVVTIGTIEISGSFTRATLPNAPVGGGFLTLTNNGTKDDRLISANSAIAGQTQIHEMAMQGDVMKMRQLTEGLVIPAGATVALEPGGLHLMFMGLKEAIAEGAIVPVELTFEKAGTITVDLVAGGTAADAPAGHAGH